MKLNPAPASSGVIARFFPLIPCWLAVIIKRSYVNVSNHYGSVLKFHFYKSLFRYVKQAGGFQMEDNSNC
jgi:hypothetical protein